MIIFYTVLFISFFFVALILRRYRSVFYALAENSVGLVNDLITDQDDETKIKLVQISTRRLLVSLIKMILVILLALSVAIISVAVYSVLAQTEINQLNFSSFYSILSLSLGATLPFLIPLKNRNKSGYSELSQLLHRLALDNYSISNQLFKRETKKIKRKNLKIRQDFVIVSGLARAGTTSLMNDLSRINDFVSLSYANMPFLMSPNIWAKIYKPKTSALKERSHKDGIMIGLNSNEALEEYFFKVKAHNAYIKDSCLTVYKISPEDYSDYLDYQCIVKLNNKKVYLAKNNNFILRYQSVRAYNDEFIMVILYREPLGHAASLLEKHKYYEKLQSEDPFVLEYMNWLGHHEFGKGHKPFQFHDAETNLTDEKESLDYWLNVWINYYRYVLTISHPNTLLINYDTYCKAPKATVETILKKTRIHTELPEYKPFHNQRRTEEKFTQDLYDMAQEIYEQLILQ